jgi:hypothetical protein
VGNGLADASALARMGGEVLTVDLAGALDGGLVDGVERDHGSRRRPARIASMWAST